MTKSDKGLWTIVLKCAPVIDVCQSRNNGDMICSKLGHIGVFYRYLLGPGTGRVKVGQSPIKRDIVTLN